MVAPFIVAALSLWIAMMFNGNSLVWAKANSFLNGRLRLGHEGLDKYGITLFGQPIKWVGNGLQVLLHGYTGEYNYVDSSYLQILYQYGCLFLILVLFAFSAMIYMSVKMEKYYLTWILLIIVLYCITEPRLINLAYNPFILLCATECIEYNKVRRFSGIK